MPRARQWSRTATIINGQPLDAQYHQGQYREFGNEAVHAILLNGLCLQWRLLSMPNTESSAVTSCIQCVNGRYDQRPIPSMANTESSAAVSFGEYYQWLIFSIVNNVNSQYRGLGTVLANGQTHPLRIPKVRYLTVPYRCMILSQPSWSQPSIQSCRLSNSYGHLHHC